jgi:alkylation response protein AidB-like acyl-CoA dehydrogenase
LQAAVERASAIADDVLAVHADAVDRTGGFPEASIAALRASGLMGILVPRAYGGLEADPWTYCRALTELGRRCPSSTMIFAMHCGVGRNIHLNATEATRRRFLPRMASGELLVSSVRNEPAASTTQGYGGAIRESLRPAPDGGYRLTATKFFATGAPGADYFSPLARLVGGEPGQSELYVLVARDDPGLEIEETWNTLGMRATCSHHVHFRDCVVEPDAAIGEPGPERIADYVFLGLAVVAVAVAEAALDFGIRFLRGETGDAGGVDRSADPNARREIGELELILDATKMMFHQACLAIEGGDERVSEPAIQRAWYYSKLAGARIPQRVLEVVGGRGIHRREPLERLVRDGETIALMGPNRAAIATNVGRDRLGPGPYFENLWLT